VTGEDRPERRVVISGLGQSAVGRKLGRSGLQLSLDAITAAVADAGLTLTDVDGLATYPGPIVNYVPGLVGPDLYEVQDALRLSLGWHLSTPQGGAQVAPVIEAVLAVAGRLCRHAVVFRTVTESSGQAGGARGGVGAALAEVDGPLSWLLSVGALSPANWAALHAHRSMHEYGLTKEQLGWVAIAERRHAARNPDAVFTEPITMEDYLGARPISSPLSLLDCDIPVDGAVAVVISAADTAAGLRRPVRLEAMGGAMRHRPLWDQWDDLTTMAAHDAAAQLWSRTDLTAADLDMAQIYDGFSIFVPMWLEALGVCGPGEGGPFVEGGKRIDLGGDLPVNTWGGQLSGGRLHGYGFLAEAIRQLRGEAGARQVAGAEVGAVGVGGGPIGGALLLTTF
jgi:acetyl-CoA acetyltransferase